MPSFEESMDTLLVGIYRDLELLEENMLNASRLNLSISEIHMLDAVQKVGGEAPATISSLSEYLAISLPSVTLSINKLAKKGCVRRQRCASDGRVVEVLLTPLGRKAERAHRYFHRGMVRELAAQMDEDEKKSLMRGVTKLDAFLKRNIEKYSTDTR